MLWQPQETNTYTTATIPVKRRRKKEKEEKRRNHKQQQSYHLLSIYQGPGRHPFEALRARPHYSIPQLYHGRKPFPQPPCTRREGAKGWNPSSETTGIPPPQSPQGEITGRLLGSFARSLHKLHTTDAKGQDQGSKRNTKSTRSLRI